jgi:hypothetical protein
VADINAGSESFQEYCARTGLNFQCGLHPENSAEMR